MMCYLMQIKEREAMRIREGYRRMVVRGSALSALALLGLALTTVAGIDVDDAKADSVRGGTAIPACTGKMTQLSNAYGCVYSLPPESGGCQRDNLQGVCTGNTCVNSNTYCGSCSCSYSADCGGAGGP